MVKSYYKRKTCNTCGKRRNPSEFYEGQSECKICKRKKQRERRKKMRELGIKEGFKKAQRPKFIPKVGQKFNAIQRQNGIPAKNNPFTATEIKSDHIKAEDWVHDPDWKFYHKDWRFEPVEKK